MKYYSRTGSSGRWRRPFFIAMIVLLVLLIGAVTTLRQVYTSNLKSVSASQRSQLFAVPLGSSAKSIAADLKEAGLIRASWAFEAYIRNHSLREKLQAGTYYLRPSQTVPEIVTVLTHGQVATDLITILPAQRLSQIRESFIKSGFKTEDVEVALDPEMYKDHAALADKPAGASLEGYLYPDSFQKTADTKPATIIRASLDLMQDKLTPEVRAGFVRQGLTVHQGVIIASIVEQEVGKTEDRPTVAQVFLKRFHQNMQLGSDVTAFYGAIIAGQTPSVAYDSPYNTRLHDGLPPGPISNVSNSSLKAVATPANTDYLYFVAGDDGVTYFSNTLQEHEALTRAHCKKLCS